MCYTGIPVWDSPDAKLQANIVEEYILLAALLHVFVALKRTSGNVVQRYWVFGLESQGPGTLLKPVVTCSSAACILDPTKGLND